MLKLLRIICAVCLTSLLVTVLMVILKLFTWTSEFSEFMLVWTVMLGGALAYAENSHLGLDILVEKFDDATRRMALFISHFLILLFAASVLLYGGTNLMLERFSMGQLMPSLGISKGWLYLSLPIAGVFICLSALANLLPRKDGKAQPHSTVSDVENS
ncbi:2,3-diketo-L-gulonate TRAP transporter small permease protein YiaM [Rubritalea halochordaticola]|uniref:2,3-diketo-L-gulonate TRAP transporter small permease protein YiaM n=1 Tax=Rubritalea halochordaticola TaxID=714537 RepID=A0ABP9V2Q2_9BACT